MSHTFFCKTCTRDHSTDLYAGMVGGDKYCTKHIAGARKRTTERHAATRKQEIALEAQAKAQKAIKTSKPTSKQESQAQRLKKRMDAKLFEREMNHLNSMELNYV